MTRVVEQALRPWHRTRHSLFPRSFARRVVLVLLLQQRLQRRALQQEQGEEAVFNGQLTHDIWLNSIVPLLPRLPDARSPGTATWVFLSLRGAGLGLARWVRRRWHA